MGEIEIGTYKPSSEDMLSLSDFNRNSTAVLCTPENGYIGGKKLRNIDIYSIVKMIQDKSYKFILGKIHYKPVEVISYLLQNDVTYEMLSVALELSYRDIKLLEEGSTYPYLKQAWDAVFANLRLKMESRVKDNYISAARETDPLPKTQLQEILMVYKEADMKLHTPEQVIQYLSDNGITMYEIARWLKISLGTVVNIVNDLNTVPKESVDILNKHLKTSYAVTLS